MTRTRLLHRAVRRLLRALDVDHTPTAVTRVAAHVAEASNRALPITLCCLACFPQVGIRTLSRVEPVASAVGVLFAGAYATDFEQGVVQP
jgi:hypothetical protein